MLGWFIVIGILGLRGLALAPGILAAFSPWYALAFVLHAPALVSFAVLGTLLFLGFSLTVGRRIVFWLIRWTNDNFTSEYAVITVILLIMIVMALITYAIGVQTVPLRSRLCRQCSW